MPKDKRAACLRPGGVPHIFRQNTKILSSLPGISRVREGWNACPPGTYAIGPRNVPQNSEKRQKVSKSFERHDQFVRKRQNSLSNRSGTTDQYNRGSRSTDRAPMFQGC